jgi:hypothetical protein
MNRRRLLAAAIAAPFAITGAGAHHTAAQSARPDFLDALATDLSLIDELYVRTFQTPSTSSLGNELASLYWVAALGVVVRSENDIDTVGASASSALPAWYVAGTTMTLGARFAASLGGQSVGDGAAAWYWDVDNPEDSDPDWRTFGIGCTAVWQDRQLLLLWGCAPVNNPVGPLFDLAASVYPSWDTDAASLVPSVTHLPIAMVTIDEGHVHTRPAAPRPSHPGS